ncbi:CocE/NonD family hydrolase [Virgibacillus salinus]|uniref:Xaa-Pro dipeptidyl-peptidase C-terminal domain-containing protein n=1 Tax=Virgibacillus salinus TaxID=553311 RepID=A0A1H1EP17_9BACI|nr:CocE/NonD family hydrolase [Virgibacillus salinus]SDQ90483.1 hypothetical protein SAMN05216231_2979 [Virgibacillus salinus]
MIKKLIFCLLVFSLIFSGYSFFDKERIQASFYPGGKWQPQSASYEIAVEHNVPITMSDGVTLLADVYRPANPETGEPADEEFPVILAQTPYKKTTSHLSTDLAGATGHFPYLVKRGYINVTVDVRGTGSSEGSWEFFGERERKDGAELVNWSAHNLSGSNGKVGLAGASYLGINQFYTAALVGKNSPLKAIFPVIAANDLYKDTVTQGGIPNVEFSLPWLGLRGALDLLPPDDLAEDPLGAIETQLQRAGKLGNYYTPLVTNLLTGGEKSYAGTFWESRSPNNYLKRIAENKIPAFMVGGWFDIFQRGTPLNYSGLQNAYAGRPVNAPMSESQPVTGRYQLVMGPWFHTTALLNERLKELRLQWFDRWLKGKQTGIDKTKTPLHAFELRSKRWVNTTHYPFKQSDVKTYYFRDGRTWTAPSLNDGYLSTEKPKFFFGKDYIDWRMVSSPFTLQTEQSSMGSSSFIGELLGWPTMDRNDWTSQVGGLTFTTEPFEEAKVLAGPISASLYAKTTTEDAQFVVTVEDIGPNGKSYPLTTGALIGSQRALNKELSWYDEDGKLVVPNHPYTADSKEKVIPGEVGRYDVEVFPSFAQIAPGHRIRITVTTADTPHLLPTTTQRKDLIGGYYQILRNTEYPSSVNLPLASPDDFEDSSVIWGPSGS